MLPTRVAFIDDADVGKTSLIQKQQMGSLHGVQSTVATGRTTIEARIDGAIVPLDVVDTAGAMTYRTLVPMVIHHACVVVLVCALDAPESIAHIPDWVGFVRNNGNSDHIVLVRNKVDTVAEGPSRPWHERSKNLN
jgi:small GTP-binding protein